MAQTNPETEAELIRRITQGDGAAFERLIRRYERLVAHMVYRLVDGHEERMDLCQDVFLKVYQALPAFRFDCKLSTWIAKIAYRTAINALEKKRAVLFEDQSGGYDLDSLMGPVMDPEAAYLETDRRQRLDQAMDQLDERYRLPLTLYHLEGMSYAEIGEVVGLPEGTVKSHLFRARKQLKDVLTREYAGESL